MFGIGPVPEATSALCGTPSSLTNGITTVAPAGTTRVSLPSVKPLKLNGLADAGTPAISWNVTVLVSAFHLSHAGSGVFVAACPWQWTIPGTATSTSAAAASER